jgi:hypothetical protein
MEYMPQDNPYNNQYYISSGVVGGYNHGDGGGNNDGGNLAASSSNSGNNSSNTMPRTTFLVLVCGLAALVVAVGACAVGLRKDAFSSEIPKEWEESIALEHVTSNAVDEAGGAAVTAGNENDSNAEEGSLSQFYGGFPRGCAGLIGSRDIAHVPNDFPMEEQATTQQAWQQEVKQEEAISEGGAAGVKVFLKRAGLESFAKGFVQSGISSVQDLCSDEQLLISDPKLATELGMSKLQVRKLQRIVLEQRQQERQQRRQGGAANKDKGTAGPGSFRPIRTPLSSSSSSQQRQELHDNTTTIDLEAAEDAAIAAAIAASLVVEESPFGLGFGVPALPTSPNPLKKQHRRSLDL